MKKQLARERVDFWAAVPRNWSTTEFGMQLCAMRRKYCKQTGKRRELKWLLRYRGLRNSLKVTRYPTIPRMKEESKTTVYPSHRQYPFYKGKAEKTTGGRRMREWRRSWQWRGRLPLRECYPCEHTRRRLEFRRAWCRWTWTLQMRQCIESLQHWKNATCTGIPLWMESNIWWKWPTVKITQNRNRNQRQPTKWGYSLRESNRCEVKRSWYFHGKEFLLKEEPAD